METLESPYSSWPSSLFIGFLASSMDTSLTNTLQRWFLYLKITKICCSLVTLAHFHCPAGQWSGQWKWTRVTKLQACNLVAQMFVLFLFIVCSSTHIFFSFPQWTEYFLAPNILVLFLYCSFSSVDQIFSSNEQCKTNTGQNIQGAAGQLEPRCGGVKP